MPEIRWCSMKISRFPPFWEYRRIFKVHLKQETLTNKTIQLFFFPHTAISFAQLNVYPIAL